MANSYAAHTFSIDTSTNVAGLTALKGSASDDGDSIAVTGAAVLSIDAALVCASLTGAYAIVTGALTVDPSTSVGYGSVAAVQAYVLALVFTATSHPSIADVQAMLVEQAALMDLRLAGAGYATPVTSTAASALLASIAVRFVAAGVIERLALGKAPDAGKAESAATWRREAEAIMAGITSGTMPLAGVLMTGLGAANGGAGISTGSQTAFPTAARDRFIEAHGGPSEDPYPGGSSGSTRLLDDTL